MSNADLEAYELVLVHGNLREAEAATGIPKSTLHDRMKRWKSSQYDIPDRPEPDLPIEEIVEHLHSRFKKRKENKQSKKWININMQSDKPIGLLWLGDPHIDDNHCDWDALKAHLSIIKENHNVFGCSLGDYQNNWVGRLSRLYSEQDTSHKTAWRLVEWLIQEMNPMILIGGNHDMWSGAGDPLKWMMRGHGVIEDWEARIQINFPNGKHCRIHAAHDMPGHSQWNALHAQTKMARFKGNADLYISGHRHNWALAQIENVEAERPIWLARARGYKYHDTYAFVKGFEQQSFGQSIMQVIDPTADNPMSFTQCFADPADGADYLRFKLR